MEQIALFLQGHGPHEEEPPRRCHRHQREPIGPFQGPHWLCQRPRHHVGSAVEKGRA